MKIDIETNSRDLAGELETLAAALRADGDEVEIRSPIRKAAGAEDLALEVVKFYVEYQIGKQLLERFDAFLADWFLRRPRRRRPALRVELYDQDRETKAIRTFGPGSYQDEMSEDLWTLYETSEGRLTEEERNLVRAAADAIELLDAVTKAWKKRRRKGDDEDDSEVD